jgi:Ca-activated chloride channel family protein
VTTLTIGLGLGYDEALLSAISDGGSGEQCFAADADELPAVLDEQVDGPLDKSVLSAMLRITGRDHILTSVSTLQDLPTHVEGDTVVITLGDFYGGETRKTLVKLGVVSIPALGLATIADLVLEYTALPEQLEHSVTLPISVNVVPGDVAANRVQAPEVVVHRLLLEASQAREAASKALRDGDVETARATLGKASADLASARTSISKRGTDDGLDLAQVDGLLSDLDAETIDLDAVSEMTRYIPMEFMSKSMTSSASYSRRGRFMKSKRSYAWATPGEPCPVCGAPVSPIMYGYPAGPQEGVILGGCMIEPGNPTVGCEDCGWRGREPSSRDDGTQ